MPPRRPPAALDAERFMKRVEDRIDARFDALLGVVADLKVDVLKGNMEQEFLTRRLSDVEREVLETREHIHLSERQGAEKAEAVAQRAETVAQATPWKVWKTRLGLITAGSAAFVAVVAFFNNLPKFVRGASEFVVALYSFIVRHR